jgi:hypothetical protein
MQQQDAVKQMIRRFQNYCSKEKGQILGNLQLQESNSAEREPKLREGDMVW